MSANPITEAELWDAIRNRNPQPLIDRMRPPPYGDLRERLRHERQDEPRERSSDARAADDAGMSLYGER